MKEWLNLSGKFIEERTPVVVADNRALKYGDGLFETMRVVLGKIRLKELHFKRLFDGMETLKISLNGTADPRILEEQVLKTVKKNNIKGPARVRLMVFRGSGSLQDFSSRSAGYIIQVWPLPSSKLMMNSEGLSLGIYEAGRKACDQLANLKSNNYLVYVMGALHARQQEWDDCLILNTRDRISDSTVANLFWVKDGRLYTPPLSEGCVAGVMRANLIARLAEEGKPVAEQPVTAAGLMEADEIFLTNAIQGLRWVGSFNGKTFGNQLSSQLFNATI